MDTEPKKGPAGREPVERSALRRKRAPACDKATAIRLVVELDKGLERAPDAAARLVYLLLRAGGPTPARSPRVPEKLQTDPELALELWDTGHVEARLLATLIIEPTSLSADDSTRPEVQWGSSSGETLS
jgi:hypothetical protein